MWRCLNNLFAYCAGKPQSRPTPATFYHTGIDGRKHHYEGMEPHCKKDPKNCKLYRTPAQMYPKDKLKQLVKA